MKTKLFISMAVLAFMLAACVMPMSQPLQLPKNEKPQLPLEQKGDVKGVELPALPRVSQPAVFTAEQIGRTDPSAYPAEIERIVNSAPQWATDPSAYPAEIEQVMAGKVSYATDPSAYPAEIERIVNSAPLWATDPSAYPAEIQSMAAP